MSGLRVLTGPTAPREIPAPMEPMGTREIQVRKVYKDFKELKEMLALLERGFAKLRAAGVKALLRFAYDRCPHGDAGEGNYTASSTQEWFESGPKLRGRRRWQGERILKHIAQLAPVVQHICQE